MVVRDEMFLFSQSARRCACGARNRGTPRGENGPIEEKMNMKFRKKMVTLLAAVLIAMMGVMPALALEESDPITLSVTVEDQYVLGISVTGYTGFDPDPIVQGSSTSLLTPILLTVESPGTVTVEAELRDTETPFDVLTSGLFYDYMKPNVGTAGETTFDAFSITHTRGETEYSIDATIYVPGDYDVGSESALLVFWIVGS